MLTENFFNKPWLILVVVFAVIKEAGAQCATIGCTICRDIEIVCEGLNSVPPLDYIDGWSNIEQISLKNGSITSIPAGYFNLSNLEIINLTYNELTTFNITSLAYATQLRTINLTGNPIVCDGNIDWLQKWKTFYPPGNRVYGTCANSREDINTYLSDKPGGLVNIKLSNSSFVFDRSCDEIFLPFIVIGHFASPLEYRAFIHGQTNQATFKVVSEDIAITDGENNFNITIAITSSGNDNEEVDALLQIISKYPVSYETNAEIRLKKGAHSCTAAAPIKPVTIQTPSSSQDASQTPIKNPGVSASPTFVSVAAIQTDRRETTSSTGTTPSPDHTQDPQIIQSQRPTLHHEPTTFPVPTTQRPTSTIGHIPTVKNDPEAITVTTQRQSALQDASETVTQKPKYGTSPPIPSMPMSPTDTAEPTQGQLPENSATRTDIRETTSSTGTTQSSDHKQSPEIIRSQRATLSHQTTVFPVPTTQGPTSTKGRTTTVKNGPEETVPAMTVTTQKQPVSQDASETVKQKPTYGTSPPISSMPMSPTDTAEPTHGLLTSTTPKQVTSAEHTLISKILPTSEPTSPQEPRKSSVFTVASETAPTGKSERTENKGCECVNDTPKGCPQVALVVIATAVVTAVVTVIIVVFIIAIWYYWSKRRKEQVDSTTPMKDGVSLDDSSTAL